VASAHGLATTAPLPATTSSTGNSPSHRSAPLRGLPPVCHASRSRRPHGGARFGGSRVGRESGRTGGARSAPDGRRGDPLATPAHERQSPVRAPAPATSRGEFRRPAGVRVHEPLNTENTCPRWDSNCIPSTLFHCSRPKLLNRAGRGRLTAVVLVVCLLLIGRSQSEPGEAAGRKFRCSTTPVGERILKNHEAYP
jgi:hypothetical protein